MTSSDIHVFLVDDHPVLLDGLQLLLKDSSGIKIVGTACNGRELLERLKMARQNGKRIDVILMDINMPVMNGLEATRQVKLLYPDIKVVMLSMRDQMPDVNEAVAKGADGFLSKSNGKDQIIDTIRRVWKNGEFVLHTELQERLPPLISLEDRSEPKDVVFTEREKRIICLICNEYGLEEIAAELNVSPTTISTHRKNIMSKLAVTSDIGIVREALNRRLCEQAG